MLAACVLLLGGCVARGPLFEPTAKPVELVDTPFFPQTAHQCGPAALATVLGASQVEVTPEQLEPQVYLPGRRGSLQVEMQAAPRRYGRLSYRLQPELAAILAELDAGRPVLVLHNYGLPLWPRWHYAVVVGYDGPDQRILLRSGKTRRQSLSAANFMRAWDNGGRWAMVLLRAGELPAVQDKEGYMEAAAAFERVATPRDAWAAFDAAVKNWPDEAVALVGRGTASYASADLVHATSDYRAALAIDPAQAAARNNLAMTLLDAGCPQSASRELDRIDAAGLSAALAEAVADTRKQIDARAPLTDAPSCAAR
jgi:tetratricopeptide (TPR) repeat protein